MAKKANPEKAVKSDAQKAEKAAEKAAKKAEKKTRKAEKKAAKADEKARKKAARKATEADTGPRRMKKVSPVPKGMHTVTPSLVFKDSAKAIEWYQTAFGAEETRRMMSPDGKSIWHAEIRIGDSTLFLNDESPMGYSVAPTPEHRPTCSLQLYVKDCDKWFDRAVAAGAKVAMPVSEMFWGDRMGAAIDPFGVFWMIATRTRKLSDAQMEEAGREFVKSMAAQQQPPAAPPEPLLGDDMPAGETAVPEKEAGPAGSDETPPTGAN